MPDFLWLLLAYVMGTGFGWYASKTKDIKYALEMLLDKLVKEGYIKTRGQGADLQLLKYWED
jgi:hypothetical protein